MSYFSKQFSSNSFQVENLGGIKIKEEDISSKFKVVIIGATNTGKTSICNTIIHKPFNNTYTPTKNFASYFPIIEVNNKKIKLDMWEIAGFQKNNCAHEWKNAAFVVVVYSITDENSFELAKEIVNEIREFDESIPIGLVGNQMDKEEERKIDTSNVVQYTKDKELEFFEEISAKDNDKFEFVDYISSSLFLNYGEEVNNNNLSLTKDQIIFKKEKKCC